MLKKILIALGSVIGMLLIVGLFLPKETNIDQEIIINKPKDVVFSHLKSIKNDDWTVWQKKDPNLVKEYKGNDGEVGFISSWSGNSEVGVGEQEIKKIVEGERLEAELRFKKPFEGTSMTSFTIEAVGEGQTKVKWNFSGPNPFPMNIMCFIMNMKKQMNQDMHQGLENLKKKIET